MDETTTEIIEKIREKTLGKKNSGPCQEYQLIYDSPSETLEPVYYWILDFMNKFFGGKVEKMVDNFSASPGGGHFAEMGQRRSLMQKNVSESMATVNTVLRSIINLIYDLKDFEIRLKHYADANSDDEKRKSNGLLALKQVWLDNVDIKRGVGSIHQMTAGNLNFVTLRDAFLSVNSTGDVDKLDLNDRVKRILKPRFDEFLYWKDSSEAELNKRFNIEKSYLKSQVNMLQLYTRWVKPYLKSATELEMKDQGTNPDLVNSFNTLILQLTLMGKNEFNVEGEIQNGGLPREMKAPKRKHYEIMIIDFYFRGIPVRQGQHVMVGGKVTVNFKGYTMNDEELKVFEQEMKKSDINDSFKLFEGATTESLDELKKDLDHFLKDGDGGAKGDGGKKEKKKSEDVNPFAALFSPLFKKKEKTGGSGEEVDLKKIKKDSYEEKLVRALAEEDIRGLTFKVYDIYKKSHSMASHDSPFE
jgi:hypothetical protein